MISIDTGASCLTNNKSDFRGIFMLVEALHFQQTAEGKSGGCTQGEHRPAPRSEASIWGGMRVTVSVDARANID